MVRQDRTGITTEIGRREVVLASLASAALVNASSGAAQTRSRMDADFVHVFLTPQDFGAQGNSDASASSGNDDTAAIQAALDHVAAQGGGTLYFPPGYYRITSCLTVRPRTIVRGAGRRASVIVSRHAGGGGANPHESLRNGSALTSIAAVNSSTAVDISLRDIGIQNANSSNVGAGFYDRGGTFVDVQNCRVEGFKYGVVLDQSELADIALCCLEGQRAGGASVWLVNGSALTPGAQGQFTNRISISRCQINQFGTTYGIIDDGGYCHSFVDNNYNGCLNHIRLSGAEGFSVRGGEFESAAGPSILISAYTLAGAGAGGPSGAIRDCLFAPIGSNNAIRILAAGLLSVSGNFFSGVQIPISGAGNCYKLDLAGNAHNDLMLTDDNSECGFVLDARIPMPVKSNRGASSLMMRHAYAGAYVRCENAALNEIIITDDKACSRPIGTTCMFEQAKPEGKVSVKGASGVTVAGATVTQGQFQVIEARKVAANTWICHLRT